jgi:hypothetical protein
MVRSTNSPNYLKRKPRRGRGASIALVALFAVLLILAAFGLFQFYTLTGGSRQLRNAVDAACLNVAKKVCEVKVASLPEFRDCADSQGTVGLATINRIWGKCLLINANVEAMQTEGSVTVQASGNADVAYSLASGLNDQLYGSIVDNNLLDNYFREIAVKRGTALIGMDTPVDRIKTDDVRIAMVDRGRESNLSFVASQVPKGVKIEGVSVGSKSYLAGYTPLKVNGKNFCFMSFCSGEMPHLISEGTFEKNTALAMPLESSGNVIPNAFRSFGEATGAKGKLTASASVVTNPQRQFELAIPRAFVTIQVDNLSRWYLDGKMVAVKPYYFKPVTLNEIKNMPMKNGKVVNGFASVGNEYSSGGTLWQIINAVPGDKQEPLSRMVQRIQEIQPKFSLQELQKLLMSQTYNQKSSKYFLYPLYQDNSYTNAQIKIAPIDGDLPGWLNIVELSDGAQLTVAQEDKLIDKPNYAWALEPGVIKRAELSGKYLWKPGSGFGQSLGELQLARTTDIYFSSP